MFKFLTKKQTPSELSNKDLNVCAIEIKNNQVVPKIRSWENSEDYVFNPTDVSAQLAYVIYLMNKKI